MGLIQTLISILIFFFYPTILRAAYTDKTQLIVLAVNESKVLKVSPFHKIQVEGTEFLKIKDAQKSIQIKGLKKGSSHIKAGPFEYDIVIANTQQAHDYKKLIEFIESQNLSAEIDNGILIISGAPRQFDIDKIWNLRLSEPFVWNVRLNSETQIATKKAILEKARQLHTPSFELSLSSEFVAQTSALTGEQKKSLQSFCNRLGIRLNEQADLISKNPSLMVTLYFIEAKKQWLSQVGVSWPPQQAFKVLPQFSGDQLQAVLNLSESQGQTRNLASPKILVKSNEKGEFLSGGEFPIRVSGFQNQSLFWKKYGLMFEIKPKIDSSRKVDLDLKFELSMIDPSRSVDGLPGLVTHSMQTQLQIKAGQSLLVSSLLKKEWGRSNTGIPGLKDIPLLSSLFSSEDFINNETELILFIQTQLVETEN